jgi:Zn-dependent protease with chaperone function
MGAAVVLASYFAVSSAGSLAARAAWAARRRARGASAPCVLRFRLAPTVAAAAVALTVVAPAFLLFEPRGSGERMPWSLGLLALGGLALGVSAVVRLAAELARTGRVVRAWRQTARRVALPGCPIAAFSVSTVFPVVAVAGVLRPRLFVSAALLRRLTEAELSVVVRHEMGHLRSRDNLKRLLLCASVDIMSWTRWSRQLDERWHEAAEDAADDHAARATASARLDLADALLKVARLSGSLGLSCPASALFRGERVARRVRRLLANPVSARPGTAGPPRLAVPAAGVAGGFVLAIADPSVHALLEKLVRALP